MTRLSIRIAIGIALGVLVLALTGLRLFGRAHEPKSRTSRPGNTATGGNHRTNLGPSGREGAPAVRPVNGGNTDPQRLAGELRAALAERNIVEARRVAEQLGRSSNGTEALIGLTLIAVGTSICGVSAIVATGPAIDAEDEEVAYAVSVITIFGILDNNKIINFKSI